jgi:hypothetical protein
MALGVYVLFLLTALLCSALLARGYVQSRHRLLFWSSICFFAMAGESMVLIADQYVVPTVDLQLFRLLIPLVGLGALLYGLLFETR